MVVALLDVGISFAQGNSSPPDAPSQSFRDTYHPINTRQRAGWFATSTLGPTSLAAGAFTAAIGTARNVPSEYGPHWEGFGKRYPMRFTGIATSNLMETSLGALWGEDPRYFRMAHGPIKKRIAYSLKMAFLAPQRDGSPAPAYARYAAIVGNNFLSNTWRADSEATNHDAVLRSVWGVLGRMGSNEFAEFWPDLKKLVFHSAQ